MADFENLLNTGTRAGLRNGLWSEFARTPARWPVVRPARANRALAWGRGRSLRWGTVSTLLCS